MDQTQDTSGAELYRLAHLYNAPEFVKSANAAELRAPINLPTHAFAWPQKRLFPVHTKAATWASYAFFLDGQKRAALGEMEGVHRLDAECVEERILHAAKVHGIQRSCESLKKTAAENVPADESAFCDEDFAFVWDNPDGTRERHLPLRNPVEVKRAAAYLAEHRDRLSYEDARQVAGKVMAKASAFGTSLGENAEFTEKMAGFGACTTAAAVELIRSRVEVSRHGPGALSELQAAMLKLAQVFEEKPAQLRSGDVRVKLAAQIDAFDEACGLRGLVRDGKLSRVEDVLFNLTRVKMASAAAEHTQTITGNVYRLEDVERVKLARLRDELGDDLAGAFSSDGVHVSGEKAAEVVPTLPRGDAEAFDRLMSAAGLAPAAKQASAGQLKLEHNFLQEMAARHHSRAGR